MKPSDRADIRRLTKQVYLAVGQLGDNISALIAVSMARTTPQRRIKAIQKLLHLLEAQVEDSLAALDDLDDRQRAIEAAPVLRLVAGGRQG